MQSFQSRLCKVTDSTLQVDSQNDHKRPTYVSGEYRVANLCFPIGKVILQGTKEIAEQGPLRGHFMVPSGRGGMEGCIDLKRVIREQLPTYGSKRCHFMAQVSTIVTGIITLPFWTHNIAVSVSPEACVGRK